MASYIFLWATAVQQLTVISKHKTGNYAKSNKCRATTEGKPACQLRGIRRYAAYHRATCRGATTEGKPAGKRRR